MTILTDNAAYTLAIMLSAMLPVGLILWAYFRVYRLPRRQKRRPTFPSYGTPVQRQSRSGLPIYEPPPPAGDTRPSRAVHLPAAITVVSSRSASLDTQIRFSGEPDWPTLSDTQPLKPTTATKTDDDPHPTRPRRTR